MNKPIARSSSINKPTYSKGFLRFLVSQGLVTQDQAVKIDQDLTMDGNITLASYLIEKAILTEEQVAEALSNHHQIPYISISDYEIDQEILDTVSEEIARKYHIIPLDRTDRTLTVAIVDPDNLHQLDAIRMRLKMDVVPILSLPREIEAAINRYYSSQSDAADLDSYSQILDEFDDGVVEVVQDREDDNDSSEADTAPVIRLVNMLVSEAIRSRCSDIHIEPEERSVRVRYRIDGTLKEMPSIPKKMQNAVISRIKIISNMDIAERRKPQDNRFKMKADNRVVDFRVSTVPTVSGEKVVMRLLDKQNLQLDLTKLGFEAESLGAFQRAIHRPFGMILVTGPTGSGKSTTLYSALSQIMDPRINIMTAEDPVEYQISGINQVHVRDDIGMGFGEVLRSFLRQDPDVIMVGEIRDYDTASIAIKAALTGHLVLSTLHTNDAPSTLNRLVDMGIEPFLVGASVLLICAQRLVRKICPDCKAAYNPNPDLLKQLGLDPDKGRNLTFYEGKGCASCNNLGYRGRVALYEVLEMSDELSDGCIQRLSNQQLKVIARKHGMKSLRDSGIVKVIEGVTTVSEVLATTYEN